MQNFSLATWLFFALLFASMAMMGWFSPAPIAPTPMTVATNDDYQDSDEVVNQLNQRTQWNPPGHVIGHEKCSKCHAQETCTWLETGHSQKAFELLYTSENAGIYARKLGVKPNELTTSSVCLNCHGTQSVDFRGRPQVLPGVSCEACHGGAGGENGWINIHASYGYQVASAAQETRQHYLMRNEKCLNAGQMGPSNLYGLVKRCYQCHVTGDEVLSNSGHDQGQGFEILSNFTGNIRHNFFADKNNNATVSSIWLNDKFQQQTRTPQGRLRVVFVLGQFVDLEISLANIARATEENTLTDSMTERIFDAYQLLSEEILEQVDDLDDKPAFEHIVEVTQIVEPIYERLDNDGFDPEDKQIYLEASQQVAEIAQQFANRNGNELEELDSLDVIPN